MEQTFNAKNRQTQNQDTTVGRLFSDGMYAYALSRPAQLHTLFRLSAAAVTGILLGMFCFCFFGTAPIADAKTAVSDYTVSRAFSSYGSVREYLSFFSAWFSHHAVLTLLPALTVITVCPLPLCYLITALRGILCGFSVCMLTGTFSAFTVYMTLAQTALCALCIYLCTKCVRYTAQRDQAKRRQQRIFSLPWLISEAAPLAVSHLLALTALAAGQLLISCVCTLLAG